MEKGLFFTADAAISFIFTALAVILIVNFSAQSFSWLSANISGNGKELFSLSVSESLVKANFPENPALGSARIDGSKLRVLSNVVDPELLSRARPAYYGGYYISALYEIQKGGSERKYFFNDAGENCLSVERFAIVDSFPQRKSILGVVVCDA